MTDKEIYKEKKTKKIQKIENHELKDKIKKIRNKLNNIVVKEDNLADNKEILEISKKLDELIAEYLKNQ